MKTKPMILALCTVLIALACSCKKYDDGPALSLKSKKSRVANDWQFDKVTGPNGQNLSAAYANSGIEFDKDGTYTERYGTNTYTGTWKFSGDKEDIVMTPNDNSDAFVLHIQRLKERELWFENEDANGVYEYQMIPK